MFSLVLLSLANDCVDRPFTCCNALANSAVVWPVASCTPVVLLGMESLTFGVFVAPKYEN